MSDEKKDAKPAEVTPPAKKGGGAIGMILPAILAAAASFGGTKAAVAGAKHGPADEGGHAEAHEAAPPGPTMQLEPFLVTMADASKKQHVVKASLAVEFSHTTKEESLKSFTPRIRDAILTYLRSANFDEVLDAKNTDKVRGEIVEKLRASGATGAEKVLMTDLVAQ